MSFEIVISIAAQLDIEQAIEWCEGQLEGFGGQSQTKPLRQLGRNRIQPTFKFKAV